MEWKTKVEMTRKAFAGAVEFTGPNAADYKADFEFNLRETDAFHPFNTDYALNKLEEDDLYDMFCEMESALLNHYMDPWNHAPGYVKPESIEVNVNAALNSFLEMVDAVAV